MNRLSTLWTIAVAAALCAGFACGGGSRSSGTRDQVTGVQGPDGAAATYHAGALPAPKGDVIVTVPSTTNAINGGSTMITVEAESTIVKIYVAIQGEDGYWEVTVPAGSSVADVLLTLAQQLPSELVIVFEVADSNGNVSVPVSVVTTIIKVATGDVAVSVSWNVENDIDLHVVDPNGFEVYYTDDVSPEGGMLDLDSNAACVIDGIKNEHIVWPDGMAPAGTYTVRVDNYDNCTSTAANYVVTIQTKGKPPQTFMGSFLATDLGDGGQAGSGVLITTFTYP